MTLMKDGPSAATLHRQLMNANQRLEVIGAQLAALKAKHIKDDPADLNLLERVAWALAAASQASRAIQSVPFDPTGHHTPHPNDRAIPGAATRRARYQREKLERHLEDALDQWEMAKDNDFMSPSKRRAPRVTCVNKILEQPDGPPSLCGRRYPAWDPAGRPNEFCTGCGARLPVPVEAA